MRTCVVTFFALNLLITGFCNAEFQVNTYSSNDQRNPVIGIDAAGRVVIVWASYLQDGSSNGIFGQHFDPNGSPIGEEFQINTTSSGNQTEPAVAMDATAGFVIAWHGPGLIDEHAEDIFARRFDPNGIPLGDEFCVNTYASGKQLYPDVAVGAEGSFLIVWESADVPDGGNKAICGRLYDNGGAASGPEFVINAGASVCRYPSVAAGAYGGFATVWLDDRSTNSIIGRLFDPNGTPTTEDFQVNTVPFRSVTRPSVAMDCDGYFVVAWDGDPDLASQDDIHARVFEPNGAPLGEQFLVNTTTEGPQTHPQVTMNEQAEFVIVWEIELDPDVTERDIFAQRFNNFGEPLGTEFQVNVFAEGDQRYPVAALGGDGRFVTAWQSYGQDGSRYGIFAETGRLTGSADFNDDGFVDFRDYSIFTDHWLEVAPALPTDLIFDDKIDHKDLAEFSRQWLAQPD